MRVAVIEDESLIAEMIKMMLEEMGHQVFWVIHNKKEGEEILQTESVDFAILDVNLNGGMEGIELGLLAKERQIPFIYLTSYSDRQTLEKAKETKPGAYVIKPFTEEELFAGIEMSLMHAKGARNDVVQIRDGHRNYLVNLDDIIYLKAENIYVEIHTTEKRFITRQAFTSFIENLPGDRFLRIHRSYAVNKDYVKSLTRTTVETDGMSLPISRSYRPEVKRSLES